PLLGHRGGREPGAHQGRREVQLQARVPVQHLWVVVDTPVHRTGDYQSGEAYSAAGPRRGTSEPVPVPGRTPRPEDGSRAEDGRDRAADEDSGGGGDGP